MKPWCHCKISSLLNVVLFMRRNSQKYSLSNFTNDEIDSHSIFNIEINRYPFSKIRYYTWSKSKFRLDF
ncbi:hypothetical protein BpHYR1_046889 [Brachionus plicatilis]|uniref:Uncharacterized protein n=1 Tax=Brachionus plicatilis TaxID=10195 RepID=A0A3M7PW66_BRAPC|nr:hypothetical protein BpHYR1_046889 [Brachionus plicatilis]